MKDYSDPLIDTLIKPPRYVFRHAQIRLVGLTHIERLTETKLAPTGAAERHRVLAAMLQPATELRSA